MITSKANETVKRINSLKQKKYREEYKEYVVEGIKLCMELIEASEHVLSVVYCEEMLKNANGGLKALEFVKNNVANIIEVSADVFEYLADTVTPQGILTVMKMPNFGLEDIARECKMGTKCIILDGVSDAGNMGTIIRTAISFGYTNILCTKGTVDAYNSKVIRSTMGAISKVKIYYLEDSYYEESINILKSNGYTIVGTRLQESTMLNDFTPDSKTVYVMGNEANGITDKTKLLCDKFVKIPMENIQESLNVAVAASILMYDEYSKNR